MQKKSTLLKSPFKILAVVVMLFTANHISAQTVITISDDDLMTDTYNWTSDNVYLLDGFVFLEAGGMLNIEPGTVIKGKASPTTGDNASALIITVGAQICAGGTAESPIIFTSEIDNVDDPSDLIATDRGLWGGVIILGDGVLGNSSVTANIEGIPTTETRAVFGGTNNSNNAGFMRYVSIRHGGAELAPGDEINGLTLGGVGDSTIIEHVEVFSNSDDGIEFFGGAVNVKYATIAFCGDDAFDWDLGWVGNGQFWFVIQGDDDADNGGEWDGAKPDENMIFSNPTVYNATFIGSGSGASASNTNAILMRDATGGTVANSIFTDYANKAIEIEDLPSASGIDSYQRMEDGDINLLNNIWYGFGANSTLDADPSTGVIRFTSSGDDPTCVALISHLTNNDNSLTDPMLEGISRFPNAQLDPRPESGSPAIDDLAAYPGGGFFTDVTYKGAFNPQGTLWNAGWTALDEYGYLANTVGIEDFVQQIAVDIYPNPARDNVTIEFAQNRGELVRVELTDIQGKVLQTVERMAASKLVMDVNNLDTGIYLIRVSTETGEAVQKIIVE